MSESDDTFVIFIVMVCFSCLLCIGLTVGAYFSKKLCPEFGSKCPNPQADDAEGGVTACPVGQYLSGTKCTNCAENTYKEGTGTSEEDCVPCAASTTSFPGSYICTTPPSSSTVPAPTTPTTPTTCPAGQYLSGTTCTNCPVNTTKQTTGTSRNECIDCDSTDGLTGVIRCAVLDNCPGGFIINADYSYTCQTPRPTTCPPNKYRYGYQCLNCPTGTYKTGTGISINDCIP